MSRPTVEPAFPNVDYGDTGMSLRDYFAAKAMQACVQTTLYAFHDAVAAGVKGSEISQHLDPASVAKSAYVYADAMLSERGKP